VALQQFDKVSRRKTLNVMKPKLEAWLQLKIVNIRELVSRSISFENWLPVSDVRYLILIFLIENSS
jgi:hypothetical protein